VVDGQKASGKNDLGQRLAFRGREMKILTGKLLVRKEGKMYP